MGALRSERVYLTLTIIVVGYEKDIISYQWALLEGPGNMCTFPGSTQFQSVCLQIFIWRGV
jgi:hypothetical protein